MAKRIAILLGISPAIRAAATLPILPLLGLMAVCAQGVFANEPAEHSDVAGARSVVGVASQIQHVVIAGSELEAKPINDRQTPIIVRVLATFRHGSDFRYDLEYYGLEPGRYDLRDYLQRKDRTPIDSAQALPVMIESRLPPGQILPSSPPATKLPRVGGYRAILAIVIGLWLTASGWLLFGQRRAKVLDAVIERIPSPAELLRPLVVDAIAGRLSPEGQAELERLLLSYWRRRLGVEDADPVVALAAIREHADAGTLLRLVEDWLHRPGGARETDIAAALAPYQHVPDDDDPDADDDAVADADRLNPGFHSTSPEVLSVHPSPVGLRTAP